MGWPFSYKQLDVKLDNMRQFIFKYHTNGLMIYFCPPALPLETVDQQQGDQARHKAIQSRAAAVNVTSPNPDYIMPSCLIKMSCFPNS
jgi:hypothetical protein